MENKVEKQAKFIELRAKGNSYDNIVKQLGVSKNTLLKWSKELASEIEDAILFEKDALMERYKMTELHLLELYGEELKSTSTKFNLKVVKGPKMMMPKENVKRLFKDE